MIVKVIRFIIIINYLYTMGFIKDLILNYCVTDISKKLSIGNYILCEFLLFLPRINIKDINEVLSQKI